MKKILSTLFLGLALFNVLSAQNSKKLIDHTVYDNWKMLKNPMLSNSGKLVSYEIAPQVGDGCLYLYSVDTKTRDSFKRGYDARFMDEGNYLVYKIKPPFETVRKAKLAKKKEEEMPKDSLAVFDVTNKKIVGKYASVKSVYTKSDAAYLVIHHAKMKDPIPAKKKKKKKNTNEIKSDGTWFEIISKKKFSEVPSKKKSKEAPNSYMFPHVTEFNYSKKAEATVFIRQLKSSKTDSAYVYYYSAKTGVPKIIFATEGFCKSANTDESGEQVAFLSSSDTAKNKVYDLWYWKNGNTNSSRLVDASNSIMTENYCVSEHGRIHFSENGKRIFFGTAPKPEKEIKDTLTEDEKYRLDIWSWTDTRLMPEQLKAMDGDKKKSWTAVYHLDENKAVQLADKTVEDISLVLKGDGDIALGSAMAKYEKTKSWDIPVAVDYYTVNLKSGEKKLILEGQKFYCDISTSGKYIIYYKRKEDHWFAIEIASGKTINLTEKITEDFFEDDNGNPAEEDSYGIMGWSKDDKQVYIYAKHDIWKVDPMDPQKPVCITKNFGRESKTELRRINLDPDNKFVDEQNIFLHSFNEQTKKAGFYSLDAASGKLPARLIESDHKYSLMGKAKTSDGIILTRMNFIEYPDLWVSDVTLKNPLKITEVNPQQKEYNWGTVELVHWRSPKGRQLDGLLYKPENFDSTKKYPLLVYFYEKYADDIHNHYTPKPSASIINPSEYASNGYVIFIPDILYDEGTPGEDAYDCIVSGTDYIVSLGFINKDRMGLQGQSWGGYQTAWLVTQTNKYRAAMAGAPVSNMTSAYGGIRWGSGWSRMFQYEKSQSRLGVTLWEDRERYIKNSPVFFADKVQTPLLIMHNDKDGAVPWYQGIEYFTALRRLNKPVWMLNYNDDDHNLTRRANQKDLSIRMRQFFDYYLLDKPMPVWMSDGLPAVDKGKKTGYDMKEK